MARRAARARRAADGDEASSPAVPLTALPSSRAGSTRRGTVLAPVALGILVLVGWQLATTVGGIPPTFLPSPLAVARRLGVEIAHGSMLTSTAVTIGLAALGCALAAVIALPLGYVIARVRLVRSAVQPYLAASQAIPAVAVAPLLVLWVGYGVPPVVLLCALLVFFPIVLATVLGLRTLDQDVVDAARIDGASGWKLVRHIEVPLASPAIMTGLRNGFTLSITGAVVGELVMGGRGLGMILSVYASSADTTGIFATLVVLSVLAVAIYLALLALERALDPLRPGRARRAHRTP